MKYYYAFFRDNNTSVDPDGRLYKVVIKTKKGNGMEELLLSGSPFIVNYENGELYKGYKCSTATIGLLNTDYNPDFICDSIMDNEVYLLRLKKGEGYFDDLKLESSDSMYFEVEWCGYTMPNTYSQDYNSYLDEFELNCQDRLSVLKYYRWNDLIDLTKFKTYQTVFQFLNGIGLHLNIKYLFITKSLVIPNGGSGVVTTEDDNTYNWSENAMILKSSYQEDGEFKYCSDVLNDIMNYFSLTTIQIADALYIVNYNAIANGFVDYTEVNYATGHMGIKRIESVYDIDKDDSAANDANMSILESYDDFAITSDLDIINRDNPTPEWYNKIVSEFKDEEYSSCESKALDPYGHVKFMKSTDWDDYQVYQQYGQREVYGYTSLQFYNFNIEKKSYYTPGFHFYAYHMDERISPTEWIRGSVSDIKPEELTLIDGSINPIHAVRYYVMSTPISYAILSNDDWSKQLDKEHKDGILLEHPLSNVTGSWDDETWLHQYDARVIDFPMLDIVYKDTSINKEHPLCFQMDIEYFADFIPSAFGNEDKVVHPQEWFYMEVKLNTGNKTLWYNNGNSNESDPWETNRKLIKVRLDGIKWDEVANGKVLHIAGNTQNRYNVRSYDHGLVLASGSNDYTGELTITIYRPMGPDYAMNHACASTFLSNINLIELDSRDYRSIDSDDIMYEYKDTSRYINERLSENLKYSSYTGKANVINQVFTIDNGVLKRLDYILDITSGDVYRAEEQRLRDYYHQLDRPTYQLELSTHADVNMLSNVKYHRFSGSSFIVNNLECDYAYNKRTITIIDKK